MDDVCAAIVLAAGSSRRMGALTHDRPKSLLTYRGEPILARLLRQIAANGVTEVVLVAGYCKNEVLRLIDDLARPSVRVVENDLFADDMNIHSMRLALREVSSSVVVFEADTVMEDAMVAYATGTDFEHRSVWFTRGPFTSDQYGGIVKSDALGRVVDVRVVDRFAPEYAGYGKMTGVMRISAAEVPHLRDLVEQYASRSLRQYFFTPWTDHVDRLPSIEGDARHYLFRTFNTPAEWEAILRVDFDPAPAREVAIELLETARLRHIEGYDETRVAMLMEKIRRDGVWTKPLYVERTHQLVLDGQHRLQAALRMGLRVVPAQAFPYSEVSVWTLRKEESVDVPTVIRRAQAGDLYPYKTVKHKFPNAIGECRIPLADLAGAERPAR